VKIHGVFAVAAHAPSSTPFVYEPKRIRLAYSHENG
jgi:hypothetical protein